MDLFLDQIFIKHRVKERKKELRSNVEMIRSTKMMFYCTSCNYPLRRIYNLIGSDQPNITLFLFIVYMYSKGKTKLRLLKRSKEVWSKGLRKGIKKKA